MRGSLQEQLLKAGLVKKKTGKKPKKHKQKSRSPVQKQANPPPPPIPKPLADHELDKPIKLQIKQILRENRVNDKDAEIPYNYAIGAQIKRCYVTEQQLQQLSEGGLAIVNWNDRSYLIPANLLEELLRLHPDLKVFVNEKTGEQPDNDDPYAEFPIPDDLTW